MFVALDSVQYNPAIHYDYAALQRTPLATLVVLYTRVVGVVQGVPCTTCVCILIG